MIVHKTLPLERIPKTAFSMKALACVGAARPAVNLLPLGFSTNWDTLVSILSPVHVVLQTSPLRSQAVAEDFEPFHRGEAMPDVAFLPSRHHLLVPAGCRRQQPHDACSPQVCHHWRALNSQFGRSNLIGLSRAAPLSAGVCARHLTGFHVAAIAASALDAGVH